MADEEKKGTETAGDADQQTGTTAADTSVGDAVAGDAAQDQDEKKEAGMEAAYKAEKQKRQQLEQSEQLLRDQLTVANATQQQAQIVAPLSDYDQAKTNLGLAGEEYIEETQRGKIYAEINRITNARNQQSAQLSTNQSFISLHPDYNEVVGRYAGTQFIPSAEITELVQRKPYLAATAFASAEGAYQIVMDERKLKTLDQKTTVQEEHLNQQGIATKLAPVSGAAAAGGAITAGAGAITLEQQTENEQRVENGG